jgi:hypothetical protein
MKMDKKKVIATIGALGLTAGVLAGCGQSQQEEDEYVKVVNSEGETMYIEEDEFENAGGDGGGMFILFSSWNGSNHSKLKSSSGYKGKTFTSKPSVSSGAKSGSGVGAKASGGKSGGFGG